MNLNCLEPGGDRTASRSGEGPDDAMNLIHGQRTRHIQPTKSDFGRCHRRPSTRFNRHALILISHCKASGGSLTSSVVELHGWHRPGLTNTIYNPAPSVNLAVFPQTQITRRDTAFRCHCSRLGNNQSKATKGTRHVMLVVERRGFAITRIGGIRAHRRQPDAVTHGKATQLHRGEQPRTVLLGLLLFFSHRCAFLVLV